ncbi:hypothetical protein BpHYR1_002792 [Brachionus plicatilis]|uniref:Uncharacterized protein n=1 Tax=Brachionus plicatilis TaxID=10195 RepID=A0A3M7P2U5_BRAPC|nr:hypothetical protein BpHYR1_002792 [Brachionus plicatilis]
MFLKNGLYSFQHKYSKVFSPFDYLDDCRPLSFISIIIITTSTTSSQNTTLTKIELSMTPTISVEITQLIKWYRLTSTFGGLVAATNGTQH